MLVTGRLVGDGALVTLEIVRDRIGTITEGAAQGALGSADDWLAPGFHDLQVNGYGGRDFNAGSWGLDADDTAESLSDLQRAMARHGTALFCPTVVTDAPERMEASLARIALAMDRDPCFRSAVTGIHLEGPFLSPEDGPRGAHPIEHVRAPDVAVFDRLQEAAQGGIRMCTLAPELPGALSLIERLTSRGVVAAIGHTGAGAAVIRDAIAAGATVSTHIGNGCHAQIPRHDSYIWEQLAADELTATLIVDGHHIEPAEARVFVRAKGPRNVALISDAVHLAGMAPGLYAEGRFEVKDDGSIVLAGTPYLAGASRLLDDCVANVLRWTDFAPAQAVACVTEVPARVLRLTQRGAIAPGAWADLTLFRMPPDAPLQVTATVTAGQVIWQG